jgi:hypothetical protein
MRTSVVLLVSAFVALSFAVFGTIQVGTAPDNRTYVWHGELVSLDPSTRTMTVKARIKDAVAGYVSQFKAGEKIMVIWDLLGTLEGDTVLYVAKYDVMKGSKVDTGYILPAEFMSADTGTKTLTFKVQASDSVMQGLKSVQPGQWVKVTTPMNQPAETATLGSVASSAERPPLTPRPVPVPQVAKVVTPEDYSKAMKAIGGAFGGASKAVQSGAISDARAQVATVRATMMAIQTFWEGQKKDDPAMIAKDAVAKMDALDKALSGSDTAAAASGVKEVGGTCTACHAKYREQDPATKAFSIKAGTL